jgi:hypothetical protein
MKRIAVILLAAAALAATTGIVGTARADVSPQTQATTEKAEELVDEFLGLVAEGTPRAKLAAFLSGAFLLQRADGSFADKASYLENPSVVESYEVSDLQATRTGPVIVARYTLVVDSTIGGQQQGTDPAPRLSVFVKGKDGWQIVAHSNFNSLTPETTITTT